MIKDGFERDMRCKLTEVVPEKFDRMSDSTKILLVLVKSRYLHLVSKHHFPPISDDYQKMIDSEELKDHVGKFTPDKIRKLIYAHREKLLENSE